MTTPSLPFNQIQTASLNDPKFQTKKDFVYVTSVLRGDVHVFVNN